MAVDSVCANGHRGPVDPTGNATCALCDAAVKALCPNGHPTALGSRFCGTCGAPVLSLSEVVPSAQAPNEPTVPAGVPPVGPDVAGPPAATFASTGEAEGPTSPQGRKGPSRTVLVSVIAVIAVLILGGIGLLLMKSSSSSKETSATATTGGKHAPGPSTTTTTAAPSTTQTTINLAAHQEAQLLSNLLGQSSGDRTAVIGATQAIASCGDVYTAVQTLNSAVTSRQNLIQELDGLTVTDIPNGISLAQTLQQAWQASVASDRSYASWGYDEEYNCTPNDTPNSNYQAASGSDQTATNAKTQFSNSWAPIAQQFGLPAYTPAQI